MSVTTFSRFISDFRFALFYSKVKHIRVRECSPSRSFHEVSSLLFDSMKNAREYFRNVKRIGKKRNNSRHAEFLVLERESLLKERKNIVHSYVCLDFDVVVDKGEVDRVLKRNTDEARGLGICALC